MVELGIKPLVVVCKVAVRVVQVPEAVHLIAKQPHAPAPQLDEVTLVHLARRRHHPAQRRKSGDAGRVLADARLVDRFTWHLHRRHPERCEVVRHLALGVLKAQHKRRLVAADTVLERSPIPDDMPAEVARLADGAGILALPGGVFVRQHGLDAEIRLGGLPDAAPPDAYLPLDAALKVRGNVYLGRQRRALPHSADGADGRDRTGHRYPRAKVPCPPRDLHGRRTRQHRKQCGGEH